MTKIIKYFTPKHEEIYFNQLKIKFFIRICVIGSVLILLYFLSDIILKNDNFWISVGSKVITIVFLIASLFLLKHKGIVVAGNIFTTTVLIVLLFFINTVPKDLSPIYKYIQGFYSVFAYLIMGILYATRPFIIINALLVLGTTTHVYLKTIKYFPNDVGLYTSSYFNHTLIVLVVTLIVFYVNKFTNLAIEKAEQEIKEKEHKNQELLASEEEIRASNEELVATTDALKESNKDLLIAIEKAKESDRLKSEFLNNMSHEVRTPMNGIIGFSQLLNDTNNNRETINNYTTIIQQSSNQLLSIIDNIIEISKLGTKQVQVFEKETNLNRFLADLFAVFEMKANDKNIGLILKPGLKEDESNILVDDMKLYSIISNLLDNAIKFTHEGKVELSYSIVDKEENKFIRFYIEDSGIGVEPDKQQFIFEKFRQADAQMSRKYGGLGLGLSIAKENVELMQGRIVLESSVGQGALFKVFVPFKPV